MGSRYVNGVSVIIPVYNREKTIRRACESVLGGSFSNVEIIIVDDGSNDGTIEVIRSLEEEHKNIVFAKTGGRKGACYARNVGVSLARYSWVAFQDSDDEWLYNHLSNFVECLTKENFDYYYSSMVRVFDDGKALVSPSPKRRKKAFSLTPNDILRVNYISTQALVLKTKVFNDICGFDERMPRFQDWELAIRLVKSGYVGCYSPDVEVVLYDQKDSISKSFGSGVDARSRIIAKHLWSDDVDWVTKIVCLSRYWVRALIKKFM